MALSVGFGLYGRWFAALLADLAGKTIYFVCFHGSVHLGVRFFNPVIIETFSKWL
ncbi:MAG: hypothetical protein WBN92_11500 [Terriglobia bacterium]|jgi:hypothetical protein